MAETIIRTGKMSDVPFLEEMYDGVEEIKDYSGQRLGKEYFSKYIVSKNKILLVAENSSRIIGALNADLLDKEQYTFLVNIIVSPDSRNNGVGGMLMKELEQVSKSRNHKSVLCSVYHWNQTMHKVMKRYSYKPSGKLVLYSKKI